MSTCSVIIPTYNAQNFIAETLESVLNQVDVAPDIVVVDDGSSDETCKVVQETTSGTLIQQANSGDSAARNAGLKVVNTDFVLFLDHDDILEPDAIKHHLAAFQAHPDAVMVVGSNKKIDENGTRIGENILPEKSFTGRDVAMGFTPSFSQCMYRRSALQSIGGFQPEAGMGADHDLNLRLLGTAANGHCHGKVVMSYRQHQNQQTRSPAKLYNKHIAILREHLGPTGLMKDPEFLRQVERRWKTYYGQFIPSEVARMMLQRNLARMYFAFKTFLTMQPYASFGAIKYFSNYFRKKP
ncbi:glycosyltransferase family 2 protein [Roseibium aggregatum]|uniref:Glycosyltransferase family 2 protein n=1 Tax=Roseibium aggregatum TaxID=187304 RepID=A0A939J114_9HYPH|nr:glycosyltransferase family A protein [Roseibium aggregatum]MBN9669868.1 glycosyltransferase family 2 protein [Roseibium aggregatum]